ncbi:hypothetical protein [Methanobrevibacter arboriphilus]|nr:hypothetical protein [Methanobrevibacter arboriphilus]
MKEFWRDVIVPHKNAGKDCKIKKNVKTSQKKVLKSKVAFE